MSLVDAAALTCVTCPAHPGLRRGPAGCSVGPVQTRVPVSLPCDPLVHKGVTGHRHEWITAPHDPVPRSVYAR